MSFIINQGFSLKSPQFNFERDYFKDLATLKAASEDWFPDFFITNVGGVLYQLNKSNSVDDTTGRWRPLKDTTGNAVPIDSELSKTSTNPVQNKKVAAAISSINIVLDGKAANTIATQSANGLLSAADKKKLDAISASATADSAIATDYIDSLFADASATAETAE